MNIHFLIKYFSTFSMSFTNQLSIFKFNSDLPLRYIIYQSNVENIFFHVENIKLIIWICNNYSWETYWSLTWFEIFNKISVTVFTQSNCLTKNYKTNTEINTLGCIAIVLFDSGFLQSTAQSLSLAEQPASPGYSEKLGWVGEMHRKEAASQLSGLLWAAGQQAWEGQSSVHWAQLRQGTASPDALIMPRKALLEKSVNSQLPSIIVISLFHVFWWGWLLSLFVIVQTIHSLLYCQADMTSTHFPYKKDTKSPFNLQFGFTDDFGVTLAILLPLASIRTSNNPNCVLNFSDKTATSSLL